MALAGGAATGRADTDLACAAEGVTPTQGALGYRLREGRCEGLYQEHISAAPIELVSLTMARASDDWPPRGAMTLRWSTPCAAPTSIEATGLERRPRYRMYAELDAGQSNFTWAADVRDALDLATNKIAVKAWTRCQEVLPSSRVYLPLFATGTESRSGTSSRYHLVVVPNASLHDVSMGLWHVPPDAPQREILAPRSLDYGRYPAGYPIKVLLPQTVAGGLYLARLTVEFERGGTYNTQVWFYHQEQ